MESDEHPLTLKTERMLSMYEKMTEEEKLSLEKWEKERATGSGEVATSDWPGWKAIIERLSH